MLIEELKKISAHTLVDYLGIKYEVVEEGLVEVSMEVQPQLKQPFGLLHGGAIATLTETGASAASYCIIDNSKYQVKCIEISLNHVRSLSKGVAYAVCTLIHKGKNIHLWKAEVQDRHKNILSFGKVTNFVVAK